MCRDDIFTKLFSFLPEENADQLWLDTIKEYLNEGGNISVTYPLNGWGFLHYASENLFRDVVNMLLSHGVNVDSAANNGSTPYLIALDSSIDAAVQSGESKIDFSLVKILIEHGANVDICTTDGISRDSLLEDYGEKAANAYYEAVNS